ncbi:MAG TPA: aminotransferase class I/II-fold pyridoxal phosphate-dependent enzyme [Actinomycetota bacterium]|nr:aminotransferase class I/II-fold pyridoxal phosphate-dependent enzyme [Actinomycetota bacterium]
MGVKDGGSRARPGTYTSRTAPAVPPIYQSTTFALDDEVYEDIHRGGLEETWYSRFGNPTVSAAADAIRDLEGAGAAVMTSSGMGAIATTLVTLCGSGDRVVAARELYGDTRDLFVRDLPRMGIEIDWVDSDDLDAWAAALRRPARVAYAECLSNPQLKLLDVPEVAALARRAGAAFVVDNTFASPYMVTPLSLGADIVVHSATKFLNGHSDVIAGCVAGRADVVEDVLRRVITFGTSLDPHAAYLVWRGLQTFEVRLARQSASATRIARALEDSADIVRVHYPGLASYPWRATAKRMLDPERTGGMVTFVVRGGDERAARFMRRLEVALEATSLGGVETLVSAPFNSSHFSLSPQERSAAGIDPGMVRLSVGLEDADALIADLRTALEETRTHEDDA